MGDSLADPDKVLEEMRANRPFDYHKYFIRAFLNYSRDEIDNMTIQEFCDCMAVVFELKQFWHLPFRKTD